MEVKIIPCLNDNYSYLIFDKNKKTACVIDPSESKPIIEIVEKNKLELKYILNTHHHFDHVGGNIELKKKYNSKIIGFKDDKDRIYLKPNEIIRLLNLPKDRYRLRIFRLFY